MLCYLSATDRVDIVVNTTAVSDQIDIAKCCFQGISEDKLLSASQKAKENIAGVCKLQQTHIVVLALNYICIYIEFSVQIKSNHGGSQLSLISAVTAILANIECHSCSVINYCEAHSVIQRYSYQTPLDCS